MASRGMRASALMSLAVLLVCVCALALLGEFRTTGPVSFMPATGTAGAVCETGGEVTCAVDEVPPVEAVRTMATAGKTVSTAPHSSSTSQNAAWCLPSVGRREHNAAERIPSAQSRGGAGEARRDAHAGRWWAAWNYCALRPPCLSNGTTSSTATDFVRPAGADTSRTPAHAVVAAGEAFTLRVQARDEFGQPRGCGGDSIYVEIRGPSVYAGQAADNLDGTYDFAAVLYDAGNYTVRGRLDYRACEGLALCSKANMRMVFSYFGEGGATLTLSVVRHGPLPLCAATGARKPPCGVTYRANTAPDDPWYRRGRWVSAAEMCTAAAAHAKAGADGHLATDSDDPASSANVPDYHYDVSRTLERCRGGHISSNLLWLPVDAARPTMPLGAARGRWIHMIGDSVSAQLTIAAGSVFAARLGMRLERNCVFMSSSGVSRVVRPDGTVEFEVNSPTRASPYLVLDPGCRVSSKDRSQWILGSTGKVLGPGYGMAWDVHSIPEAGILITSQWQDTLRGEVHNGRPPFASFALFRDPKFYALVDEALRFAAANEPPAVADTAAAANASAETPATPEGEFMTEIDAEGLKRLFPQGRTPDAVLVNVGLHHVAELDEGYFSFVTALLERVRADFPPEQTRLFWRSTSQTQWREAALPDRHRCRTSYRMMAMNDLALDAVVRFNAREAAHGRPEISVVDYLQISLGREDAAPDNRHYTWAVQTAVLGELLNVLAECKPE